MAKIPFDIKYRQQIESGEYKVETESGTPAKIIDWEWNNEHTGVCLAVKITEKGKDTGYLYTEYGKRAGLFPYEKDSDLFIVTPEEELTPFEKELVEILKCLSGRPSEQTYEDYAKEQAAELFSLAIDARAKELYEGLQQSKLDKDSIPYHLIEFMCNLYDCKNWKEIEGSAELYVTRIKVAAMKDLPRWRVSNAMRATLPTVMYGNNGMILYKDGLEVSISDLEKLPGFNK